MSEPFFIVGFQRSGTTLLRLMLDAHPEIAIPLDTAGLWARYETKLAAYGDLSVEDDRRRLVGDILAEERIRLWKTALTVAEVLARWTQPRYPGVIRAFHECYAVARGKKQWAGKDPGDMVRLDQLNRWFPAARFIHIIRDGRDACLSQLQQDFGFDNLFDCAVAWREEVQWVRRMGALLGPRYYEIRYEDLVAEPERHLRSICRFLDIEFNTGMLRYHERVENSVPEEKRHLWPLLEKPPQAGNTKRWKVLLSNGERICFEKRAGGVLGELGYEVISGGPSGAYLTELGNFVRSAWLAASRRLRL